MSNYWRKREQEHIDKQIKDERKLAREIKRRQLDMMDDIDEQINAFYGRYAKKEGISMEDARKRISKTDIEKYKRKAKRYVKQRNFTELANAEMRQYNVTMRINRLELLKRNIDLEVIALTSDEERMMKEVLTRQAADEFERQSAILGESLQYNEKKIRSIVNSSFQNATWSDRLWSNQKALRSELDKLLHRGIVQGLNPRELAIELRKNIDTNIHNSERLLITETARVQTDVFKDSMIQNDYHAYEIICEPTACEICEPFDGQIFQLSEMEVGETAPPFHPQCKCSQASAYDRRAFEQDLEARGL